MTTEDYADVAGRGGETKIGETRNPHVVGAIPESCDMKKQMEDRRGEPGTQTTRRGILEQESE